MDSEKESNRLKSSFMDRQKKLRDQLCVIEKSLNKDNNHTSSYVPKLDELSGGSQSRNKIKGFKGRQSIFKRPEGPAPRTNIRTIPDYHKNPNKWTYYSLDDVSDISNESNQQTAFLFLNEMKNRRQREEKQKNSEKDLKQKIRERLRNKKVEEDIANDKGKNSSRDSMEVEKNRFQVDTPGKNIISFQKPKNKQSTDEPKPEFRNNKMIMPEYNFGVKKLMSKKTKPQKNIFVKIDKNKEMKLDHLQVYDDEEE